MVVVVVLVVVVLVVLKVRNCWKLLDYSLVRHHVLLEAFEVPGTNFWQYFANYFGVHRVVVIICQFVRQKSTTANAWKPLCCNLRV